MLLLNRIITSSAHILSYPFIVKNVLPNRFIFLSGYSNSLLLSAHGGADWLLLNLQSWGETTNKTLYLMLFNPAFPKNVHPGSCLHQISSAGRSSLQEQLQISRAFSKLLGVSCKWLLSYNIKVNFFLTVSYSSAILSIETAEWQLGFCVRVHWMEQAKK